MVNKKLTDVNKNDVNQNIDIQALVLEAVKKASEETAKQYEEKISKLQKQLEKNESVKEEESSISPQKMVKIMHMSPGSATFEKGRINVKFDKLFDERKVKFEILDEMYYSFRSWFDDFEIVILDKDVRDYYNIEYRFKEHGADKNTFIEILKLSPIDMIKKVDKYSKVVAWAFLKFFLEEYIKGNPDCLNGNKFGEVQNYYNSKYNITHLQETVNELIET